MTTRHVWLLLCLCFGLFASAAGEALSAEPSPYKEGKHGKGRLLHIDGVPVLVVEGSPAEMGEQTGVLAVRHAKPLYDFPRQYFRRECTTAIRGLFPKWEDEKVAAMEQKLWPRFEALAVALEGNFPPAHREELDAIAEAAGEKVVSRRQLVATNGMFDLGHLPPQRLLTGCSSVIIPPGLSDTGGLLFGRNLDFSHLGYLHRYSLLTVYRPGDAKKHAFVSAGFPGFVGCFTGMNDAGLTIASHEVFEPATETPFDPKGVPFAMAYRRVLEECETVGDAVKLLDGMERASVTSLVIADTTGGAVIDVTPDTIAVRRFRDRPGVCTNHFCTLKNPKQAEKFDTLKRFDTLTRSVEKIERLGVADIQKRLHAASMKDLTIQTFVFEPQTKTVHVRFGDGTVSATQGKLVTLDLTKLWGSKERR
jgi:predicted choloylglycine hydrolase